MEGNIFTDLNNRLVTIKKTKFDFCYFNILSIVILKHLKMSLCIESNQYVVRTEHVLTIDRGKLIKIWLSIISVQKVFF